VKAFRVLVPDQDEDEATAILAEAGTTGIEVTTSSPSVVSLLAYFEDPIGASDLQALLRSVGNAQVTEEAVPTVDWLARFREGFRAFRAGGFEIVPAWDALAASAPPSARRLVVDPGRAFGTGTHETTRLCLAALEAEATQRPLRRVLDVGTGTGLLAVAAARLGAAFVAGVDNDPEAVASARGHAELNAVHVHVLLGDGARPFRDGLFDLVLANLMAPLLVERRDELTSLLVPEGTLVLSGLLVSDLTDVKSAYAPLGRAREATDGEWAALTFRRRAA
jgi:ribosomal protein L11 methyltransferase